MKMVSLGQKYDGPETVASGGGEYFPNLYLDKKQIEALELGADRVGAEMMMIAKVKLSSISESQGGHRSMSFDIVEACFKPKEEDKDHSSILFPNG